MAAKWWEGPLTVFDIESTGRDVETARIVSSCIATIAADGSVMDSWEVLLNPGIDIEPGATAVHGFTNEMAADGNDPEVVLPLIAGMLAASFSKGIPVVAFNGRFDFTVLDRECRRHDINSSLLVHQNVGPVLDPYVMDKAVDQYRRGSRKLGDMCTHYGVQLLDAHNATADAVAAGRLAQVLVRKYKGLQMPGERIHQAQRIWARQQAASLEIYLRRKDDDDTIVCERDWPLIPFKENE